MGKCRYSMPLTGIVLVIALLATACAPANPFRAAATEVPGTIKIVAPANYSTATSGGTIEIRAQVNDPNGIIEVQLRVDGQALVTQVPPAAPAVTSLVQDLYWTPEAVGSYQIQVVAQNGQGNFNHSQPITIYVVEVLQQATVIAAALATATPTPFPPPTPTPVFYCPYPRPPYDGHQPPYGGPQPPGRCRDNAAFVTDVTIPDGSLLAPGTAFDKTWRLRNTGTCTWDGSYQLAFIGGSQLGAPNDVPVPGTVPPGATVDITVPMVAPNAPGTYRGQWQMRNTSCMNPFGPVIYVVINTGQAPSNLPVINRFEVSPNVINPGQSATLYWDYVNGSSANLYPDGQSVGPSGSITVAPNATTTYRLVVSNPAGTVERSVTLVVQTGSGSQPPPPSPANLSITAVRADGFDFSWIDTSNNEQGFRLYNADSGQVVATFAPNSTTGTVGGLACGTGYRFYLVAFNNGGESWPSNTVQATTSQCNG
jgi:hypothetical protein